MASKNVLKCKVIMLDGELQTHQLSRKSVGQDLYDAVYKERNLKTTDYFGLEYTNKEHLLVWLEKDKLIAVQLGTSHGDLCFKFMVKFYIREPHLLEDDLTRHLFAHQIKQDLARGSLHCQNETRALLAAYIVQSEIGDLDYSSIADANDHSYLKGIKLLPNQDDDVEEAIMEEHKKLREMTGAEAEIHLLEMATKLDTYGVVPSLCKDDNGQLVQVAVRYNGIHVYKGSDIDISLKTYIWAQIRKLGFKRKKFIIKLYTANEKVKNDGLVEFAFDSRDAAKNFWKMTVENHSFFQKETNGPQRRRHPFLARGSSFRYTGRTQLQLLNEMRGTHSFDGYQSHSLNKGFRGLTRSVTCNDSRDFGRSMTLDRKGNMPPLASESRITVETRYSGDYDTDRQTYNSPNSSAFPHSKSLNGMSLLAKPHSMIDLKSHTSMTNGSLLLLNPSSRNTNRDSIAQVEDNRVELEKLVEQINQDLSASQKTNLAQSPVDAKAFIDEFLAEQSNKSRNKLTVTEGKSDSDATIKPVSCAISDDETLELILKAEVKDTPVTDLDKDTSSEDTEIMITQKSQTERVTQDHEVNNDNQSTNSHEMTASEASKTLNDVLDKWEKEIAEVNREEETTGLPSENPPQPDQNDGDEDVVFTSNYEFKIPESSLAQSNHPKQRLTFRSRIKSKQEEMDDLEDLSQLAEQVLESQAVSSSSQDLSDLASSVLDFTNDTQTRVTNDLADLSDLLAQFDKKKRQQEIRRHQENTGKSNGTNQLEIISNVAAAIFDDDSADDLITACTSSELRSLRKPELWSQNTTSNKPEGNHNQKSGKTNGSDSYKSDWMLPAESQRFGLKISESNRLSDSGIEVIAPMRVKVQSSVSAATNCSSIVTVSSLSDGYNSSESLHSDREDEVVSPNLVH